MSHFLTKLVGEIFDGTNDACDTSESVIDIFWISSKSSDSSDSSISQVIPVIPESQVIPVSPMSQMSPVSPASPVSLAHLWVNFRVILYQTSFSC